MSSAKAEMAEDVEQATFEIETVAESFGKKQRIAGPGEVQCHWCCGDGCRSCKWRGVKVHSIARSSNVL